MNPIKLFAEVTLNSVPVMDARVTAELRALNQSGFLSPPIRVELLDTGSGGECKSNPEPIMIRDLTPQESEFHQKANTIERNGWMVGYSFGRRARHSSLL